MTQDVMSDLFQLQELEIQYATMLKAISESPIKKQISSHQVDLTKLSKIQMTLTKRLTYNKMQQKALEDQLSSVNIEIKSINDKMYDSIKTPTIKELSSLQRRLEELKTKADHLEAEVIESMEVIDSISQQLVKAEAVKAKTEHKLNKYEKEWEYQKASSEIEEQIITEKIQEIRQQIPQDVLETYEKMKKTTDQKPIAYVSHGVCQGCRVELPRGLTANTKTKSWPKCENCGRYLHWPN